MSSDFSLQLDARLLPRVSTIATLDPRLDKPTAVSTTGPIPNTGPTAVSNSHITAPTKPSKMSSDFSLQLDARLLTRVSTISQSFCLTSVSQESRPFSRFHWKREVRFANS